MAFQHGKNAHVTIDGNDWSPYCDQQSLDRVIDLAQTTAFGDDDHTSISGVRGHTIQVGGHWDPTHDGWAVACDDGATVAFAANPEGNTAGDVTYTGNCLISNYSWQAGVGDRVTWSASFTVTGAVTRSTV